MMVEKVANERGLPQLGSDEPLVVGESGGVREAEQQKTTPAQ